jgi:hypothetical protein
MGALLLLVCAVAPNLGQRVVFGTVALPFVLFTVRGLRVHVDVGEGEIVVHGQFRTRRVPMHDIEGAELVPMATASPLRSALPYVALGVRLRHGDTLRFNEISVSASSTATVEMVVDEVNARVVPGPET